MFHLLFLISLCFLLMFKLLLGWLLKISHNLSHIILTWLLHYISAPRQSAQSEQLSFQLPLLKSCINIPDQLILSRGFKPHWHADESLIKWQAWEPSDGNEFTHAEHRNDRAPVCKPRRTGQEFSLLSPQPIWKRVSSKGILNCTQLSKHPSLNTMKHITRKEKERLFHALKKWNIQFSGTGRLMWIKEVQTSTGADRSCQWVSWKTWILSSVRAVSGCSSLVAKYILVLA